MNVDSLILRSTAINLDSRVLLLLLLHGRTSDFERLSLFLGSPFSVNVAGHGSSRLKESITRERRAVDITHIGSQCELSLKIPGMYAFHRFAHSSP
jgi:hypothetical protein